MEKVIELTENDLVICTNGCQGDASAYGDQTHAPVIKVKNGEGPSIEMWKKLAAQDPAFGHPEKFFKDIKETSWESWTVDTANKQILDAIRRSASATRCPARSLPAASSPAAIRAGSSAGPSTVRASSRSSRRITA